MSSIEALLSRVSVPRVLEPGVTSVELDLLLRAGLRACDHGRLNLIDLSCSKVRLASVLEKQ